MYTQINRATAALAYRGETTNSKIPIADTIRIRINEECIVQSCSRADIFSPHPHWSASGIAKKTPGKC